MQIDYSMGGLELGELALHSASGIAESLDAAGIDTGLSHWGAVTGGDDDVVPRPPERAG